MIDVNTRKGEIRGIRGDLGICGSGIETATRGLRVRLKLAINNRKRYKAAFSTFV